MPTEACNILTDVTSRQAFRAWLEEHHATQDECWVVVKKGRPTDDDTFWYLDAVEEALCFGWIDSINRPIDGVRMQRFSPRKPRSFKMDPDVVSALKAARCWSKFKRFPPLYQRIRVYNVAMYKDRMPDAYERALANLIAHTKRGEMFGDWNDYGRLL